MKLRRLRLRRLFVGPNAAMLTLLGIASFVPAQPPQPNGDQVQETESLIASHGVTLPMADRRRGRQFRLAEEHLSGGRIDEAIPYFQAILDSDDDLLTRSTEGSSKITSLRAEVVRKLKSLSPDEANAYELRYGTTAATLLKGSLSRGDWHGVAEVARRFPTSNAGKEARFRLAMRSFDRGDVNLTMIGLEDLVTEADDPLRLRAQIQLVRCYAVLENHIRADATFDELIGHRSAITLAGQKFDSKRADEIKETLLRGKPAHVNLPVDWPMPGGGPDRASYRVDSPGAGADWSVSTFRLPLMTSPENDLELLEATLAKRSAEAETSRLAIGQSINCITQAVATGDLLIFRTPGNITALDATNGQLMWRTLNDALIEDYFALGVRETPSGLAAGRSLVSQRLFDDATWGTLAANDTLVFTVEDSGNALPLPAVADSSTESADGQVRLPGAFNRLVGYESKTGRRCFEMGGPLMESLPLAGTYFLGSPISHGDSCYVLGERDGQIELIAFDPSQKPSVIWTQAIAAHEDPITQNHSRRTAGLTPSLCGGILVCPAGAGLFVAVEPVCRTLLWAARIGDQTSIPEEPPPFRGPFSPSPVASRGWSLATTSKAILIGASNQLLAAIDPLSGNERWSLEVPGLLWLIGIRDDVVFVQVETGILAFKISDGAVAWDRPAVLGPPSGLGVIVDERLYVPLSSNELAILSAQTGRRIATVPAPADGPFGNLIAHKGAFISQSVTRLISKPLPR